MEPEAILKRVGVFVAVFVVVVGMFALGAADQPVPMAESPDFEPLTVGSFQPETIAASPPESMGEIPMSADATGEVVLIDAAHENDVSETQLRPIVQTLTENGATVRFLSRSEAHGSVFNETLREADAFLAINPTDSFTDEQIASLEAYEAGGGRIVLVDEPAQSTLTSSEPFSSDSSSPPAMAALASEFGLSFGTGYLYNMHENANNYRTIYATPAASSPLTDGIERVVIREGTTVSGGQPFLTGLDRTTLSSTRQEATYPIGATAGNVVALGDTSFFTETGYQFADNEVLTGRLLDFMVGGEKDPDVPGESEE